MTEKDQAPVDYAEPGTVKSVEEMATEAEERGLKGRVEELAAYPLPTMDSVVGSMSVGGKEVKELPDAAKFLVPHPQFNCASCGLSLMGLFGRFQWGLAFGEGQCMECGWPARGAHDVALADGTKVTVQLVLQYEPGVVAVAMAEAAK